MAHPAQHGEPYTFYPAFCHKLSPTFFRWVKMRAVDVHRLQRRNGFEGQNLYFHLNHPIQFICVAGIILTRDEQARRTILVLDDSTGSCLEIICSKALTAPLPSTTTTHPPSTTSTSTSAHQTSTTHLPLDITPLIPGVTAKLKGTLTTFRGMLQLHLERYALLPDTNAEVTFWDARTRFLVDVLSVPWVVGQEEVEGLRREGMFGAGSSANASAGAGAASRHGHGHGHGDEARRVKRRGERERIREERGRREEEREERDRLRILRRWEREEGKRRDGAERCREISRVVNRCKGRRG
ncbi:hypothetical protein AJ80_07838 [Polytolypa hystricis UAMH7299]|uniref:CST complex subunit Stn1 N-terminal domain-containing protein n=1 Tax=Polytolypa hystricis (strain UAMH7299) TaxID=1447883 RepID=A0A2B7XIS4_POLH7|nr:hypothetical protein AJ80_07838 [Polytolypa hystricis UAMH7299]